MPLRPFKSKCKLTQTGSDPAKTFKVTDSVSISLKELFRNINLISLKGPYLQLELVYSCLFCFMNDKKMKR